MVITTFAQLMEEARKVGPKTVAIAAAQEKEILLAAQDAEKQGLCECILVGDRATITEIAQEHSIEIRRMMIIHEPDPKLAARKVMELVGLGHAQIAMKGKIETGDFLRAALDKEAGLRVGRLLTHVGIFEIPGFDRLIFISDAGVVVAPTMEQKIEIVQNAIYVAQRLGVEQPKVAILAATEMVNPKIPTTLDAANLSKMADRGQIKGGLIDGPLALDNAISLESAQIKGIKSDVAGQADILIPPDVEAANVLAKAITYFAKGSMAGVVVGGKSPIIMASRSDPHETKLVSMALGVLLAPRE
ncbi:MAG: bifunctional enoyl-CoA hydratase/phosphate acetyltransferase [Anaerolineales bacterium]|nr:bifunctional enoyl-CoA hydratase/phosphate acetyltransferase [Anaerolineales bacterium]